MEETIAEIVNLSRVATVSCSMKLQIQPNNLLKSETFNRFEATKDRSPRFRAFVIFLLIAVSSFLVYATAFKGDATEISKSVVPGVSPILGHAKQPSR